MKKVCFAALVAGLIAVGFSIYPQYRLQSLRGSDFKGAFATYDLDETAYAAHLQALIDGRPRKSDPYTGRDDSPSEPLHESIFSIQSATAYPIALAARAFGATAAGAMPVVSMVSAFLTAIALFSLIYLFCRDAWMSMAGTLVVIAGGALISGIGAIGTFSEGGVAYPYLPLLRRHIPSMSFPFLFGFLACLFTALRSEDTRRRIIYASLSCLCFGVLLFSYFYLWTASLAILAPLGAFILIQKDDRRNRNLLLVGLFGAALAILLIPYAILLSGRNTSSDAAILLVFTHGPDLLRNIEIIGAVVAAFALIFGLRKIGWIDKLQAFFIASFGLSAFIAFNQQVITGRSLQPFHYEYYSVNYVVLLALVLFLILIVQRLCIRYPRIKVVVALVIAVSAAGWGTFEVYQTSKFWDDLNLARDDAMPVNRRLSQLAKSSPVDPRSIVTINFDSLQGDSQPTVAQFAVLWARHQNVFAGIANAEESKQRYYKLLYFTGLDEGWLRKALTGCEDIEACMTLFGWDRFNSTLSANARGLTKPEIENEVQDYARFSASFGDQQAYSPRLSFAVARKGDDLHENLTRWYEVGSAEDIGEFYLFEIKPKSN